MLRRNGVPDPKPGIVCALFHVLPAAEDMGRRFPHGRAVFPFQFRNGLFRALKEQGDDFAILQLRHFLSASP